MRRLIPFALLCVLAACESGDALRAYCETKCNCELCDVDDCVRAERLSMERQAGCEEEAEAYRRCVREHGECSRENADVAYWEPGEACVDVSRDRNACVQRALSRRAEESE